MSTLEELLNIILSKSEQLEDKIKQKSDLKDLTPKQLYCIELIHRMGNPTLTELAKKMDITKASASVMIDRMEEHKYIEKIKSDNDRRSAHVHLTGKGHKAAHLHVELHFQFAKKLTQDLTESEKDILIVLLNKAVGSLI